MLSEKLFHASVKVRRGVSAALPDAAEPLVRDGYHKLRLLAGHNPLGKPTEHRQFLERHLPDLRAGLGGALGAYVEFGVYQGASLAAAVQAGLPHGLDRYVGFDSFAGLPPGSEDEGWGTGWFRTSRSVCEWNLRRLGAGSHVTLVEGWFEDTCNEATTRALGIGPVSVAMIDCDVYSASKTAWEYVTPLLTSSCLVVFDDWYGMNPNGLLDRGQPKLFTEYLAAHPEVTSHELGELGNAGRAFRLDGVGRVSTRPG